MIRLLKGKMEAFHKAFQKGGAGAKHDCSQLLLEKGVGTTLFYLILFYFMTLVRAILFNINDII